nr:hypothetical protein Iba_chr12eCG13180 [Ipomoea batatas]
MDVPLSDANEVPRGEAFVPLLESELFPMTDFSFSSSSLSSSLSESSNFLLPIHIFSFLESESFISSAAAFLLEASPLKRFPHRPLDFLHTLCRVLSILRDILIGALPSLTPASNSASLLLVDIILRHLLKLPLLRLRLPLLQSLLGVHVPQPPPAHVSTGIEIGLDRYRWSGEIYDSVLAVQELHKHLVDSGDFHTCSAIAFALCILEGDVGDAPKHETCINLMIPPCSFEICKNKGRTTHYSVKIKNDKGTEK